MAKLDEYWNQIQQSDSFKDLDTAQKEKVRSSLWDKYVQKSPSYTGLPLSQRNQVRQHFDDLTQVKEEGMMEGLERKGKKIVAEAKPLVKKAGQAISNVVDVSKVGSDIEDIASTGEEIPGMKKAAETLKGSAESIADVIEPSEEGYGRIGKDFGTVKSWNPLTQFDMARAVASGGVRFAGQILADTFLPETTLGASVYVADPVLKYAGSTFLGKDITTLWKPKTGLSSSEVKLGDSFEKMITQENINQNVRGNIDAMKGGPPRPLEVLAHEEAKASAQNEVQQYNEWLKQADQTSDRGGEPAGDLYPEAKTNVSQLRDAAQERLRKLQDEPVRVESISRAEDELQGYYRRRIDQARVYMMPSGPETQAQGLLPEPDKPAGLLEAPESVPERPPTEKSPSTPGTSQAAPVRTSGFKAKDVLTRSYAAFYPGETREAIAIRAGAALKAFGFKPTEELSQEHLSLMEKFLEQEHLDEMAKQKPPKTDAERLKEKGLDSSAVKSEAKRLQEEHEFKNKSMAEERSHLKNVTGGIAQNRPDATGRIPEQKEIKGVPGYLRGTTAPDKAAQMAFDAGLTKDASLNSLLEYAKKFEGIERPRSAKSFMDEAEYRLGIQNERAAGFKPPAQENIPGMPGAQMPSSGLGKTEGQVPADDLLEGFNNQDIAQKSLFDIVSDIGGEGLRKLKGEGGGFNTEDFDPMKQAALEANIKELVSRARALGYKTSQDIMLYAARNAPTELQNAMRKNLHPTLSAFDTHAYQEMEEARKGNPIAKKGMMDSAQRNYLQKKMDIVKGTYRKFKANQQIVVFKDMDEGLMRLQNDLFIHDNYRKFSKDELAAQRWYTEGKSPKLESLTAQGVKEEDAKRWLDLAKNPSENMKAARPMTQIFEDEYHDLISEFYDKVGYVEDHVTRRWKQPREYLDWEGRTLENKPSFVKGRKLKTQADGIDAGFEPVSYDIREDLRASNNQRVNTLSRIHAYQKLGASFGPEGSAAIMDESGDAATQAKNAKITPHRGQAPNSWLRFQHVPLLNGLAIHPYYEDALKFMMTRPFTGAVPEFLDFAAASTKAAKLYGFFHGYTLGEMTATGISYRDVFSFNKNRNVMYRGLKYMVKAMTHDMEGDVLEWGTPAKGIKSIGKIYNSFMTGSGMLANRPLALDMAEHGFKFGSADEDMHGILKKFLNKIEDYLKKRIGEGAAKGLTALPRTAIDIQEKALWSYIRPVSSMLVYETNLKDAIKEFNLDMPEGKKMPIEQIKQAIVNQTSKEMGGISYARLMINPRTQQVLQWAMLAPGWTIGRALMGAAVLEGGPEGRQARKQMTKLFVSWFMASNMINYAQTKKYLGKGRYMWENPPEYRNRAFLNKSKDGSTHYLQLSKALTEIYDDIDHPMRTGSYKLSGPVQAAVKVINWAGARAYNPGQKIENPLVSILHSYEPMMASGQSAYGGIPISKGPSANKVEAVFDEYYRGGMKNPALLQEAQQMAIENGYDIGKLDRYVRSNITKEKNRALFK